MIVEITSFAPVVAFSTPAMPAHAAPASVAPTIASRTCGKVLMPAKLTPIQFAMTRPTRYWPSPPMLNIPQRKAKATASPVKMSVVDWSSVWVRLYPAIEVWTLVVGWKIQFSPAPSKMSW